MVAGFMTLLVAFFLVVAVLPLSLRLSKEVKRVSGSVTEFAESPAEKITQKLESVPFVGEYLAPALKDIHGTVGDALVPLIGENKASFFGFISKAAQGIAYFFFTIVTILFCSFFIFRGGQEFASESGILVKNLGGSRAKELINVAWATIIGVVYGVICTAVAQGLLAGIGFYFAGAPSPVLLGVATMVISFLPFGAPLIYVPVSIFLLLSGESSIYGIGLLLWGVCVVSIADNILRPLFISGSTNLPLFLSLLGVLGGLIAFGLIGVFVGPMILALVASLWKWWVDESRKANTPSGA